MKKIVLFILSILVACFTLFVSFFVIDRKAPKISVTDNIIIACDISKDGLLNYARVEDENYKSLFIEEYSIEDVADKSKVTFVAMDKSNNVSRLEVPVKVEDSVKSYHIEQYKPLQLQINTKLIGSDYFALKNDCGWDIKEEFNIKNINTKQAGKYNVVVSSRKHHSDDIEVVFEVGDFLAPKINLRYEAISNYAGKLYSDEYFLDFIENIEDDNDDPDVLLDSVKCNWKDVLSADENGLVSKTGTYTISYVVTDSEGHVARKDMKINLSVNNEVVGG